MAKHVGYGGCLASMIEAADASGHPKNSTCKADRSVRSLVRTQDSGLSEFQSLIKIYPHSFK